MARKPTTSGRDPPWSNPEPLPNQPGWRPTPNQFGISSQIHHPNHPRESRTVFEAEFRRLPSDLPGGSNAFWFASCSGPFTRTINTKQWNVAWNVFVPPGLVPAGQDQLVGWWFEHLGLDSPHVQVPTCISGLRIPTTNPPGHQVGNVFVDSLGEGSPVHVASQSPTNPTKRHLKSEGTASAKRCKDS